MEGFQPGIVDCNFQVAAMWAADLGYTGNFQLAVDDTKVMAAMWTYLDNRDWKVGGMHERVKTFASYEKLLSMTKVEHSELAEKLHQLQFTS